MCRQFLLVSYKILMPHFLTEFTEGNSGKFGRYQPLFGGLIIAKVPSRA